MLPLPLTPEQCAEEVIAATFWSLLPARYDSREARVMLLAIALQESGLAHRQQVGGPARGLWQFEQRGGVAGVLAHDASRLQARAVCLLHAVAPTQSDVYGALGHDDVLACAIARLLLWTDPQALPKVGDVEASFACYLRTWRPGAYDRDPVGLRRRWSRNYSTAMQVIR